MTKLSQRKFPNILCAICNVLVAVAGIGVCISVMMGQVFAVKMQPVGMLLYSLIYAAIAILICFAIIKLPVDEKHIFSVVILLCFALRFAYVLLIKTQPISDFVLMYSSAVKTVNGDLSWMQDGYFQRWAYQIPFVLYEALIVKVFGGMLALKLINVLFMLGIDVLIYLIGEKIAGKRPALCAALLYAIYPDAVHLSSVLTNQHIAAFFFLMAVFFILKDKREIYAVVAGISLGISQLMRPEAVVMLVVVGCMAIWLFLQKPDRNQLKYIAINMLLVFVAYLLVTKGTALLLMCLNAAPFGLENNVPEWKFVLGLDFSGSGAYSEKNIYILDIKDAAERKTETIRIIKESYAANGNAPHFFLEKIRILWADETGGAFSMNHMSDGENVLPFLSAAGFKFHLSAINIAVYLIMWIGATVAIVKNSFGTKDNRLNFLTVLLIGFFMVFLLVEVQSRYKYIAVPVIAVISAKGFNCLKINRKRTMKNADNGI